MYLVYNGTEMNMLPWSATEKMHRDAEEMRAFYQSVGLSDETIERALEAKFAFSNPKDKAGPARKTRLKTRGRHVKK